MDNKKSYKGKIFIILSIIAVLVFAYFADEKKTPEPDTKKAEYKETVKVPEETQIASAPKEAAPSENQEDNGEEIPQEAPQEEKEPIAEEASKDAPQEEIPKEEKEPQNAPQEDKNELYCTLSVRCDTVFDNISRVSPETLEILPKNGVIFAEKKVEYSDGESVFDVLLREMKNNKIHLEFVNTPVYGSVYVEGIGNLYEFDAGELSGWMYKVNGVFPNYGCSKYYLKKGDKVEFVYTCDLGKDVGGAYAGGQGGKNE